MTFTQWRRVVSGTIQDIQNNHTLAFAAALSYYFVMGLFPALIALGSIVAYLPVPNLFNHILAVMGRVVPPDSMGLINQIVLDIISPYKGKLLSFGLLATIWAVSSGFSAIIEALNVAYDVPETRPIWKTRLIAIGLTFEVGTLFVIALVAMLLGPQFGDWLAAKLHISRMFAIIWPYLRWTVAVAFIVFGVEALYFIAPNVRQKFRCTFYGAVIAVGAWIGLSYLLGLYIRHYANFNKTYGTLGAAIALMVWLYWTGFAILLGGELNSEIIQVNRGGTLPLKQAPPEEVTPKPATSADIAA
jgi:membrane protein